jgi:hypothetical protein
MEMEMGGGGGGGEGLLGDEKGYEGGEWREGERYAKRGGR